MGLDTQPGNQMLLVEKLLRLFNLHLKVVNILTSKDRSENVKKMRGAHARHTAPLEENGFAGGANLQQVRVCSGP